MSEITKQLTPFWERLRKFWVDLKNRLFAKLTKHKVNEEIKAKHLSDLLNELGACKAAVDWQKDKGIERAVAECPNSDWLLWLAVKLGVDERLLFKSAGYMLESIRWMFPKSLGREIDNACLKAIDAMISDDKSLDRFVFSHADYVISRDVLDTPSICRSKYFAVLKATRPEKLPFVATSVAYAKREYASGYGDKKCLSFQKSWANCADICREHIGQAIIEKVNGRMANSMQA